MPKSVLVCVAHPDDEVLGCGGMIARHVAEGDDVHVIIATDGETARLMLRDVKGRYESARRATSLLGARVHFLGHRDQQLDSGPLLRLIQAFELHQGNIIYTHHLGDLNLDHRLVAQAVLTAFRPLPGSAVEAIYGFETPSSTEWGLEPFVPTRFVDVGEQMKKKIAALREYDSEIRQCPHARSYENMLALARLRGNTVGIHWAEAFTVLREIIR